MIRAVLDTLAATSWRDWLAVLAEFIGAAFVVAAIAFVCIGLAPI